jgi:hypothetical protein
MRPLLIVGSIPIEALHQLTQSAILQQVGFGSLLNLAPGDASGQFLCHDAREFHFVIAAKRRHPKGQTGARGSGVEFREVLREWEGLSYKQIADVVDIPMGTVMSRLARARKRLQESLASRGNKETSGELLAVGAI